MKLSPGNNCEKDLREPSTSFLLKQLSIMRRFSSSNRSALLAAAAAPGPPPFARSMRELGERNHAGHQAEQGGMFFLGSNGFMCWLCFGVEELIERAAAQCQARCLAPRYRVDGIG